MAPILTRCPRTTEPIPTGLDSHAVILETLPNVPIPVICSACGSTHYWMGFNAWVEGEERLNAALQVVACGHVATQIEMH